MEPVALGKTITRRELAARQKAFASAKVRSLFPRWMAVLAAAVFLPFGIAALLRASGPYDSIAVAISLLSFPGVFFWAWLGDVLTKRLQRDCQVVCPQCDKPLVGFTGELALTTGRCGGCGNIIVED